MFGEGDKLVFRVRGNPRAFPETLVCVDSPVFGFFCFVCLAEVASVWIYLS